MFEIVWYKVIVPHEPKNKYKLSTSVYIQQISHEVYKFAECTVSVQQNKVSQLFLQRHVGQVTR
jgi:hypothetical protein